MSSSSELAQEGILRKLSIQEAMIRALELALNGPAQGINPQVGALILSSQGCLLYTSDAADE